MRKTMKILSLLLAIAMILVLAVGCTKTEPEPSVSPSESASPSASPSPSPSESIEPAEKSLYPVTDEVITLSVYWGGNGMPLPYMDAELWSAYSPAARIEEATNVRIEWFGFEMDVYVEKLTVMLASRDYADMFNQAEERYTGGIDALIDDNVALNLSDMLPEYAPDYYQYCLDHPNFFKQTKSDSGNIACVYEVEEEAIVGSGLIIRQDFLDKVNMPIPTTYEELFDALKAFKTEVGTKHTMVLQGNLSYNNDALSAGYDVAIFRIGSKLTYIVDDNGKVSASCVTPQFKEYFQMLREWFDAGVLSDETLTIDNERFFEDYIIADQIGFWGGGGSPMGAQFAAMSNNPDFNPRPMADLTILPDGKTHLGGFGGSKRDYTGYCITTQCQYPEAALSYLNYFFTEEGILLTNFGVEDEAYVVNPDGSKSLTELITNNPDGLNMMVTTTMYRANGPRLVKFESASLGYTTDAQRSAAAIWGANRTRDHYYYGSLTVEEADQIGSKEADLATLVDETIAQLVFGIKSFETDWDKFQSDLIALDIEGTTAVRQTAYDRYLRR